MISFDHTSFGVNVTLEQLSTVSWQAQKVNHKPMTPFIANISCTFLQK
jgi:hypothetical protein